MRKADIHDSCSYLSALCLIPHRWSEEITLTFITENIQEGGFLAAPPVFKASFDKHRILQFEKIDYKCLLSFSFFFFHQPRVLLSYTYFDKLPSAFLSAHARKQIQPHFQCKFRQRG